MCHLSFLVLLVFCLHVLSCLSPAMWQERPFSLLAANSIMFAAHASTCLGCPICCAYRPVMGQLYSRVIGPGTWSWGRVSQEDECPHLDGVDDNVSICSGLKWCKSKVHITASVAASVLAASVLDVHPFRVFGPTLGATLDPTRYLLDRSALFYMGVPVPRLVVPLCALADGFLEHHSCPSNHLASLRLKFTLATKIPWLFPSQLVSSSRLGSKLWMMGCHLDFQISR